MKMFIYVHLVAVIPALLIGTYILLKKKGTEEHKKLGRWWAYLMVFASFVAFGIQSGEGFSWLHGLAAFTIYNVIQGVRAAKAKEIRSHQGNMFFAYLASLVAFVFAIQPHRIVGQFIDSFINR